MKLEKKDDRKIILGKSGLKFDLDGAKESAGELENSISDRQLESVVYSDNKKIK